MSVFASIFYDFNLPNAATWFYFALLLAVALFFKFTRLLSVRNFDVLAMFLLVPGLLLIQEAQAPVAPLPSRGAVEATRGVVATASALSAPSCGLAAATTLALAVAPQPTESRLAWLGFLWLFCGSALLLIRCLFDLALVQRPALGPNLNAAGLAWLGVALFVCLVAVAVRKPEELRGPLGKPSVAVSETQRRAGDLLRMDLTAHGLDERSKAFWAERSLAMLCHLAVCVGLVLVGWRHFQDAPAGMAAATFYLLLPYTAYHVEQIHHVWPATLLTWAVVAYRLPTIAGLLLGLGAGSVYFPVFLFPVWVSFYRNRGAGRFAAAFGLAMLGSLTLLGVILWSDGRLARSLQSALSLADWQPWVEPKADILGFWTGLAAAWAYRLPVAIAYLTFVATTVFWPKPKNLAHVLALSAALLLGIQFWYADQGGVYVLWYLPVLLLMVFRPNLSDRLPPVPADGDWVFRLKQWLNRQLRQVEPVAPV